MQSDIPYDVVYEHRREAVERLERKKGIKNNQVIYDRTNDANWRAWVPGLLIFGMLAIVAGYFAPVLIVVFGLIALNALVEYHKWFTAGLPLDLELLYGGAVVVTAIYGVGWGFILALVGPIVSELARGEINREALIKTIGVGAAVLVASLGITSVIGLLFAVAIGLSAQFIGAAVIYNCSFAHNVTRRATVLILAGYMIVYLRPMLV